MPNPTFSSDSKSSSTAVIVTSISRPSEKIRFYSNNGAQTFWIGDLKTPEFDDLPNLIPFTYEHQISHNRFRKIADLLPKNHYSRKNIGYLLAYLGKYDYVLDTDDDNFPLFPYDPFPPFFGDFPLLVGNGRVNIYKYFTGSHVWPRGLGYQFTECDCNELTSQFNQVAVWQGLADCDPDVDAIYRLAGLPEVTFEKHKIYTLEKYLYCPFNSQNTLWQNAFLPYSYLPSTVTFRYTDILRGYVAQRCFWEHDSVLGFTSPNVYQARNQHNLLSDLESELSMYKTIDDLLAILNNINLSKDSLSNLVTIYGRLASEGIVDSTELNIIAEWCTFFEH